MNPNMCLYSRIRNLSFLLFLLVSIALTACQKSIYAPPVPPAGTPVLHAEQSSLLLSEVLMRIQLHYVEPKRLEPYALLEGALLELERVIPELYTRVHTSQEELEVNIAAKPYPRISLHMKTLYDLHQVLQKLLFQIKTQLPEIPLNNVEIAVVEGILKKLDPHSALFPAGVYKEFKVSTNGRFAGVGMVVGMEKQQLTVIAPMEGSPAARAGVLSKDQIMSIDHENTADMTINEILLRLRGEIGSQVQLQIVRKGVLKPFKVQMVRESIKLASIESLDLVSTENKTSKKEERVHVRYVRLKSFQKNTSKELLSHLNRGKNPDALILDLRNNPGGLLEEAVAVSDLFLPRNKTIVSTQGSMGSQKYFQSHQAIKQTLYTQIPIVVLINGGSASASEIVAAALKQHQRAVLLGEQSFGKGSVQSVWEIQKETGLKLTIAQYLTPGERSIQAVGVAPNITLHPVSISEQKMRLLGQLFKDKERDLPSSFTDWQTPPESPDATLRYLQKQSKKDKQKSMLENIDKKQLQQDFFIQFAQNILEKHIKEKRKKKRSTSELTSLLQTALKVQKQEHLEQEKRMVQAFKEQNIDWRSSKKAASSEPSKLQISATKYLKTRVTLEWKNTGKTEKQEHWTAVPLLPRVKRQPASMIEFSEIPSQKKMRVHVEVQNTGKRPLYRLMAYSKSTRSFLDQLEFPIGFLAPGESRSWDVQIQSPVNLAQSLEHFELLMKDQQNSSFESQQIFLHFQPHSLPRFRFSFKLHDDGLWGSKGNGDGVMQAGESIALRFDVENLEREPAKNTLLRLKESKPARAILQKSKVVLGELKQGVKKQGSLLFELPAEAELPKQLTLKISDGSSRTSRLVYDWHTQKTLLLEDYEAPRIQTLKLYTPEGKSTSKVTALNTVKIEGQVKDDQEVKDVFIFLNGKKVYYQPQTSRYLASKTNTASQSQEKEMLNFSTTLQLKEGNNKVVVFARDQQEILVRRTLRVWHYLQ